ncbi:hypothetical protein PMAYCL1PPCAC_32405, partial [Pristionchus mayeri]
PNATHPAIETFLQKYPSLSAKECIIVDYWTADGHIRWAPFLSTMFFAATFTIELTLIIALSILILKIFRNKFMSAKLLKMQKQLFYTLFLQFMFPLLLIYFPPIILLAIPLTFFFSYGFVIFPLIDSLIIIFGIRDYRCWN